MDTDLISFPGNLSSVQRLGDIGKDKFQRQGERLDQRCELEKEEGERENRRDQGKRRGGEKEKEAAVQ